jgi:tubulin alpha
MGNACWELFCLEHNIRLNGEVSKENKSDELINNAAFFDETQAGIFKPRALYVDLDCKAIDEVSAGPYK